MKKIIVITLLLSTLNQNALAQTDNPYAAMGQALGTLIGTFLARMSQESSEEQFSNQSSKSSSEQNSYRDEAFEKQKEKCAPIENTEDFLKCMREVRR